MCVIINIENGDFPKFSTLKSAEELNDHGGSIAWLQNGKINYQKGIKAKTINQIIENRLKPNNVKIAIIHFRIASVGEVNKKLCHPFQISNKVELDLKVEDSKFDLLFHNGTVTNWQNILITFMQGNKLRIPKGELSDSRIMAFLINHGGHKFLKKLAEHNKFSILTKEGIIKYGKWVKVDKNQCSNDYFMNSFNYYNGYQGNTNYQNNDWWANSKYNKQSKNYEKNDEYNKKLDKIESDYDNLADKVKKNAGQSWIKKEGKWVDNIDNSLDHKSTIIKKQAIWTNDNSKNYTVEENQKVINDALRLARHKNQDDFFNEASLNAENFDNYSDVNDY